MTGTALDTWDDTIREELCHQLAAHGWSRQFPGLGYLLMMSVAIHHEPSSLADLQRVIGAPANRTSDWDASCWEEFEPMTAETLEALNAEYGEDDGRSVEEVNAESLAIHEEHIATVDRYAAHLGFGPVRTCRELLDVIVATGVIHRGEDGLFRPTYPLSLPEDVLPVTPEELTIMLEMRREDEERRHLEP